MLQRILLRCGIQASQERCYQILQVFCAGIRRRDGIEGFVDCLFWLSVRFKEVP